MHYKAAVVLDGRNGFGNKALEEALAPFEEYDGIRDFDRGLLVFNPVDCTEEEAKYYERDPITGKPGYYVNPNGRWDSWELWRGCPVGEGGVAKPEDLEAEDGEARKKAEAFWDGCVEVKDPDKYVGQLFKAGYGSKDAFAYSKSHYVPFAFVDEDGKWHDQDSGVSKFIDEWKAMIQRLKGTNAVLVMVDYHI